MALAPYVLASRGAPKLGTPRMVIFTGAPVFQRFDYNLNRWVDGRELASIFMRDPAVMDITQAEARTTIEDNGGTWAAPKG